MLSRASIALLLLACAGASPTASMAGARSVLPARLLPAETQIGFIAAHEGDRTYVVLGSLRASIRLDADAVADVEWGRDRFADPIRVAGRVNDRWVFAAGDGTLAASDSFTGPLRSIGFVRAGLSHHGSTTDPSRLIDREEHAWRCDGVSLADDGAADPMSVGAIEELPAPIARALRRRAIERYPGLALDGATVFQGAAIALEGERLVRFDPASGHVLEEAPMVGPSGECQLRAWGPAIAATCNEPFSLWRSRDGRTFERIAVDPDAAWRLDLSDDGVHGAIDGPCERDPQGFPRPALCVLDGALREIAIGEDAAGIDAIHGMRALVVISPRGDGDDHDTRLRWIDLTNGASRTVGFAPSIDSPDLRLARFAVGLDGELMSALVVRRGGSPDRPELAVGRGDRYERIYALPERTRSVAFVDEQHAFAAGDDLGSLYRTDDGGAHWIPIALEVSGSASASRFALPDGLTPSIACSALGCLIAGRVLVPFAPLGPAPDERVLAGPS